MNKKSFPSFKSAPKDESKEEPKAKQSSFHKREQTVRQSSSKNTAIPVSNDIFLGPLVFNSDELKAKEANSANLSNYPKEFNRETAETRHASFTRKLRKDPKNIDLWLEFVAFQDNIESFKKLSRRKQLDRKISILERAIYLNSSDLSLIELQLNLSAEVDSFPNLLNKWNRHLDDLESREASIYWELALKYLTFRTCHFSCFNRDEVMSVFAEFFKKPSATCETKLQLLGLLFSFLNKTGHFEILVALIQIIVEANIEIYNYGAIDLEAYADLWDSDLYDHVGRYTQNSLRESKPNHETSLFTRWAHVELQRSELNIFPDQDDEVADLDRKVLFHDISLFIVTFAQHEMRSKLLSVLRQFFNSTRISNAFRLFETSEYILHDEPSPFCQFGMTLLEHLLPFFADDWELICTYMLLHYQMFEDSEFIKQYLSTNRESAVHFLAFGIFNLLLGDLQQARKVLIAVTERGVDTCKNDLIDALSAVYQASGKKIASSNFLYFKPRPWPEFINWVRKGDFDESELSLNVNASSFKVSKGSKSVLDIDIRPEKDSDCFRKKVYDLIQANVGDKQLYIRLIQQCACDFASLGRELYKLMMEQQLRIRCLLEEIE